MMSPSQIQLIFFFTLLHLSLQFAHRDGREKVADRDIRSIRNNNVEQQLENKKRPFCNAFTGCGKKRSSLNNQLNQDQGSEIEMPLDDTIGSLLDLNSEPAIEDLMRQIMSEAKLWEAIQEANREINYQRSGKPKNGLNIAFNTQ